MPSKNPSPNCRASRCTGRRVRFSGYCAKHTYNLRRHGHPTMSHISMRQYRAHRERITEGLLRYAHSKPMLAAVEIADHFLNYKPERGFTYERYIAQWATRARAVGVAPMDLLQAVAEFQAVLESSPRQFPDARAERHALARRVLRLGPNWGKWRPHGRLLNNFGAQLRDALGSWAWAFLKRIERDAEERRALYRAAADWDAVLPTTKRAEGTL